MRAAASWMVGCVALCTLAGAASAGKDGFIVQPGDRVVMQTLRRVARKNPVVAEALARDAVLDVYRGKHATQPGYAQEGTLQLVGGTVRLTLDFPTGTMVPPHRVTAKRVARWAFWSHLPITAWLSLETPPTAKEVEQSATRRAVDFLVKNSAHRDRQWLGAELAGYVGALPEQRDALDFVRQKLNATTWLALADQAAGAKQAFLARLPEAAAGESPDWLVRLGAFVLTRDHGAPARGAPQDRFALAYTERKETPTWLRGLAKTEAFQALLRSDANARQIFQQKTWTMRGFEEHGLAAFETLKVLKRNHVQLPSALEALVVVDELVHR
ncbi:MAG: hypothetical protein IT371_19745 [Deltaproteobacteria bacterium]|nr:hypothetical protein [Deltaproteobacteria bacterium]